MNEIAPNSMVARCGCVLIEKYVVPVFLWRAGGNEHVGSAVLIASDGVYQAVTAAHVVALQATGIISLAGSPSVRLSQWLLSSSEPDPDLAASDKIDLASVGITPEQASAIMAGGFEFMPLSMMDLGSRALHDEQAFAVGFPLASVTIVADGTSRTRPHVLVSSVISSDRARKHGLSDSHIGVRFEGRLSDVQGRPIKRPDTHCMSGGGIWVGDESRHHLVAVIIEFHATTSVLLGTRLTALVAILGDAIRRQRG